MKNRTLFLLCLCVSFVLLEAFWLLPGALAQVMQSGSYQIQSDSMNFGGGRSSSTNYLSESTFGEVATGEGASASYKLKAGYQQMQEVYIALTGGVDVIMNPSIPGVTGGVSNGSTTVTGVTDSPSGYSLSIAVSGTPAMQGTAGSIADYVPSGAPDFVFTTDPTDSHFGFSPEGSNIVARFKDNGSVCNAGALDGVGTCWDGLSTTPEVIASSGNPNHPLGATTSIRFRVGVGGSAAQAPGFYTATTTITALPL
jgi:hypothetical protein